MFLRMNQLWNLHCWGWRTWFCFLILPVLRCRRALEWQQWPVRILSRTILGSAHLIFLILRCSEWHRQCFFLSLYLSRFICCIYFYNIIRANDMLMAFAYFINVSLIYLLLAVLSHSITTRYCIAEKSMVGVEGKNITHWRRGRKIFM